MTRRSGALPASCQPCCLWSASDAAGRPRTKASAKRTPTTSPCRFQPWLHPATLYLTLLCHSRVRQRVHCAGTDGPLHGLHQRGGGCRRCALIADRASSDPNGHMSRPPLWMPGYLSPSVRVRDLLGREHAFSAPAPERQMKTGGSRNMAGRCPPAALALACPAITGSAGSGGAAPALLGWAFNPSASGA